MGAATGRSRPSATSERGAGTPSLPGGVGSAWGLTLLRVTVGGVFAAHGLQKVLLWGWSGGAPFFEEAGIPLPHLFYVAVVLAESLGGAALIAGLFTRLFAAGLAVVMSVALVAVHLPHGFFLPNGVEFVLVLGVACVTLAISGGGPASLDGILRAHLGADAG